MLNAKIIVISFITLLCISVPVPAQDLYMFIGDTDGAAGDPVNVGVNTMVDIPVYFMCGEEGMACGYFNCSVAINNFYSDYFDSSACYYDSSSCVLGYGQGYPYNWDSYHFNGLAEDATGLPFDNYPGGPWDSFSMWALKEGPDPYLGYPFISIVPEIIGHFAIHIKDDIISLQDTSCWLLAPGKHQQLGLSNAGDTTGNIAYNVIMDFACYSITGMHGLAGIVTDSQQQPIEGAIVTVLGEELTDTTDANGEYGFSDVYGYRQVSCHADDYTDIIKTINISQDNITRYDIEMCAMEFEPDTDIMLWAGGSFEGCEWQDIIEINPGSWIDIPVYALGVYDSVNAGSIIYPLGINNAYIDSIDFNFSEYFYPLDTWNLVQYTGFVDDWQTDSLGNIWDSYSFYAVSGYEEPGEREALTIAQGSAPLHLFTFRLHVRDDIIANGEIISDLLCEALEPFDGGISIVDTLAQTVSNISSHYGRFKLNNTYQYLPGDCNMRAGNWPPVVVGGDVTYMVGSFRGLIPMCMLDGFRAAGDVNGDCLVTGGDVVYLVNYFRGMNGLSWCEDYPPAWQVPEEIPLLPPTGWPNCD